MSPKDRPLPSVSLVPRYSRSGLQASGSHGVIVVVVASCVCAGDSGSGHILESGRRLYHPTCTRLSRPPPHALSRGEPEDDCPTARAASGERADHHPKGPLRCIVWSLRSCAACTRCRHPHTCKAHLQAPTGRDAPIPGGSRTTGGAPLQVHFVDPSEAPAPSRRACCTEAGIGRASAVEAAFKRARLPRVACGAPRVTGTRAAICAAWGVACGGLPKGPQSRKAVPPRRRRLGRSPRLDSPRRTGATPSSFWHPPPDAPRARENPRSHLEQQRKKLTQTSGRRSASRELSLSHHCIEMPNPRDDAKRISWASCMASSVPVFSPARLPRGSLVWCSLRCCKLCSRQSAYTMHSDSNLQRESGLGLYDGVPN